MFTAHERELHDQYDQANDTDKDRIDRAYKAAAAILKEDGRKLCNCDGAEQLIAALWRHYSTDENGDGREQLLAENHLSKISGL